MTDQRTLSLTVSVGETVTLDGGRVSLTIREKSGQRVGLTFQANPDVQIARQGRQASVPAQYGIRKVPAT